MFNRITFSNGVMLITLIALTMIMVSEESLLNAGTQSCNPNNPNCNYVTKTVIVVHIGGSYV